MAQNSGHEPHLHSETIGLANRSRSSRVYSAYKMMVFPGCQYREQEVAMD